MVPLSPSCEMKYRIKYSLTLWCTLNYIWLIIMPHTMLPFLQPLLFYPLGIKASHIFQFIPFPSPLTEHWLPLTPDCVIGQREDKHPLSWCLNICNAVARRPACQVKVGPLCIGLQPKHKSMISVWLLFQTA